MNDRLKMGREAFLNNVSHIQRAYNDLVYQITKASLEPVVAAISDVIREAVAEAVKEGVKDALTPATFIGELFKRKK